MKKLIPCILSAVLLASCQEYAPKTISPNHSATRDTTENLERIVGYSHPGTFEETYLYDGQVFNLDVRVTQGKNGELESTLIPGVKDYNRYDSLTKDKDLSSIINVENFGTTAMYDHMIEGDEDKAIVFYNSFVDQDFKIIKKELKKQEAEKLHKSNSKQFSEQFTYNVSFPFLTLYEKSPSWKGAKRHCRYIDCPNGDVTNNNGSARIKFGSVIYYRESFLRNFNDKAISLRMGINSGAFKANIPNEGFNTGSIQSFVIVKLYKHANFKGARKQYYERMTCQKRSDSHHSTFYLRGLTKKASSYSVYVFSEYYKDFW